MGPTRLNVGRLIFLAQPSFILFLLLLIQLAKYRKDLVYVPRSFLTDFSLYNTDPDFITLGVDSQQTT